MQFTHYEFGVIEIDGVAYDYDVVVDRGEVHPRKKKASRSSARHSATRRCRWRRTFPGSARAWLSAPGLTAACRSWTT